MKAKVTAETIQNLYNRVNDLMAEVGRSEITINAHQERIGVIMDALFEIDDGAPDDKIIINNWPK